MDRVSKERIEVGKEFKSTMGLEEAVCDPILQTMILNQKKSEFNVVLESLCE